MHKIALALALLSGIATTMNAEEIKLSANDLEQCSFEDPGAEPIWRFFLSFCKQQPAKNYPEKDFQALSKLPPKLHDVCLILRYELEWSNGGTQAAAVLEDATSSAKMLAMTAAAYAHFGDLQRQKMIIEIGGKLADHQESLDEADRNNKLDDYVSPLDKYDSLWETVDHSSIPAILKDIKSNPNDYIFSEAKPDPNGAAPMESK